MHRRLLSALATVLAVAAGAGCTAQALWRTGQQWQKQDCARFKDPDERRRCERSAATPYEPVPAEAEAARSPPESP